MKKFAIATGVAVLALAMVASAQGYAFNTNLTVGSTGQDVVALQTWLMSSGYKIPSIATGAASTGYFGSQTKAAVQAYQTANGVPSTGFVGPLTRGKLNGAASVATVNTGCPAGYTCTLANAPGNTLPATVAGAPTGITTPGVVGTLAVSLWSSPSGIVAYKGQAYDVASYKIQASASDMALQNLTLDFETRLWLYASAVTVKDETGAVIGQVSNLNFNNFSELTVGSQYRLSIPVNGVVIPATKIKYLTVNVSFLPTSDRGTGSINVTQMQVRSVDGTGVTDTQTSTGGSRSFSYQGSGAGSVIVTTDSASPATGLVQLSTSVQTQNVVLAIFDVKSQNAPSTIRKLNFVVRTAGTSKTPSDLFGTFRLQVAGQTYSADSVTANASTGLAGSSTVSFTTLTIPLAADTYVPVKLLADVNVDTNNALDGTSASTTLVASGNSAANGGTITANNPGIEDSSYSAVAINSATFTSNAQTFTGSGLNASGLAVTYGGLNTNSTTGTTSQKVFFAFNLTAGNNPIYLSSVQGTALSTSTNPSGITVTASDFSDTDTSGDSSGNFYLSPGQTKSFTATYTAIGLSTATGGAFTINAINFGTSTGALASGSLTSSALVNGLKAVLFH